MASLEHVPIGRHSDCTRARVRPQAHLLGQLGTMNDKDTLHFMDLMKSGGEHNPPDPNPLQTHWGRQRMVYKKFWKHRAFNKKFCYDIT